MRLDMAFFGRDTARDPIVLRTVRGIEHEARWRKWTDCLWVAASVTFIICVLGAAIAGFVG